LQVQCEMHRMSDLAYLAELMSTRPNLVSNKVVVSLLGETNEKADQEARSGVSWNWLSPCEAAGEAGAADICGRCANAAARAE
jgi:hypothetical protein